MSEKPVEGVRVGDEAKAPPATLPPAKPPKEPDLSVTARSPGHYDVNAGFWTRALTVASAFSGVIAAGFAAAGWLVSYFWIYSAQVELNKEQVKLAVAQAQATVVQNKLNEDLAVLARAQATMTEQQTALFKEQAGQIRDIDAKLDREVGSLQHRASLLDFLIELRESISPRITFSDFRTTKTGQRTYVISQDIDNNGKRAVIVVEPTITMSLSPSNNDAVSLDKIDEKKGITITSFANPGYLPAGTRVHTEQLLTVHDRSLIGRKVYITIRWHITTNPDTIESVRQILVDGGMKGNLDSIGLFNSNWLEAIQF